MDLDTNNKLAYVKLYDQIPVWAVNLKRRVISVSNQMVSPAVLLHVRIRVDALRSRVQSHKFILTKKARIKSTLPNVEINGGIKISQRIDLRVSIAQDFARKRADSRSTRNEDASNQHLFQRIPAIISSTQINWLQVWIDSVKGYQKRQSQDLTVS